MCKQSPTSYKSYSVPLLYSIDWLVHRDSQFMDYDSPPLPAALGSIIANNHRSQGVEADESSQARRKDSKLGGCHRIWVMFYAFTNILGRYTRQISDTPWLISHDFFLMISPFNTICRYELQLERSWKISPAASRLGWLGRLGRLGLVVFAMLLQALKYHSVSRSKT